MSGLNNLSVDIVKLAVQQLKEHREENHYLKKQMDLNRQIYFVNIIQNDATFYYENEIDDSNIESRIHSETHFFNTLENAQKFISEKKEYYEENYEGIEIKDVVKNSDNFIVNMKYLDKNETYQELIAVSIKMDRRYQCHDDEPFIKIENNF